MTSLIITTYNRPDALELVLMSVLKQAILPDEVIIADDGSTAETKTLVDRYDQRSDLSIRHVWQPDLGFRAARVRNLALAQARGDYIIYLDGDQILHPKFIWSHMYHRRPGYYLQGSRVHLDTDRTSHMLSAKSIDVSFMSPGIINRWNAVHTGRWSSLVSLKSARWDNVRSCNMSLWKSDLVKVNGFNEAFEGWGREDNELVVRLMNQGIIRKNVKGCAVTYHLEHRSFQDKDRLIKNDQLLNQIIKDKSTWAEKGLDGHF